jgi:hypothetical protein
MHAGDNMLIHITEFTPGLASHAPLACILERPPEAEPRHDRRARAQRR